MYFPWYKILWNCIWILPYMTLRILLCLIMFLWQGPKAASTLWHFTN